MVYFSNDEGREVHDSSRYHEDPLAREAREIREYKQARLFKWILALFMSYCAGLGLFTGFGMFLIGLPFSETIATAALLAIGTLIIGAGHYNRIKDL